MAIQHSLCWDCRNSCGEGCSWSTNFTPVAGWDAEPTTVDGQVTYYVKSCPQFVRDAYEKGRYTPDQYIEHLEKAIEKLRKQMESLQEELKQEKEKA